MKKGGRRNPTIDTLRRRIEGTDDAATLKRLAKDPRAGVRVLVARQRRRLERSARERDRLDTLLAYERPLWSRGILRVAGIDEAGSGPLAGPVVAAAVILLPGSSFPGIDDSKALSAAQRDKLADQIKAQAAAWGLGLCTADEVDTLNILEAGREAMRRAVLSLSCEPEHLLVDARTVPMVEIPQTPIIHGDRLSQSIAAASILAKVERDRMMKDLAQRFPGYGFERHMGYGTAEHLAAIARLGPCPEHRRSFAPLKS